MTFRSTHSTSEKIKLFRSFMSKDQNMKSAGRNRIDFYNAVILEAKKVRYSRILFPFNIFLLIISKMFHRPPDDKRISEALTKLREVLFGGPSRLEKMSTHRIQGKKSTDRSVDIFLTFDEAQTLSETLNKSGGSQFIVLRRALSSVSTLPLFTFFLSTTGSIMQLLQPRDEDPSRRISGGKLSTPPPYIFLGFDQLMQSHKVFEQWNTLDDVTLMECASHMGRPL
jgi:hypothetical protein